MNAAAVTKDAWRPAQAYALCAVCLVLGMVCGYLIRGAGQTPVPQQQVLQAQQNTGVAPAGQPTPEMIQHTADVEAEPLLAQVKANPKDPQPLAKIGDVYYNAQIYPAAIFYYSESLQLKDDPDVRTNMGSAYYYGGDADAAIAEFEKTLKAFPKSANALFDLGMVKWQGKMDIDGAVAAWTKLLKDNPNHPRRAEVEQLMARARQHSSLVPQKASGESR